MLFYIRRLVYTLPVSAAVHEMILEGLRLAFCAGVSALMTYLLGRVQQFPYPEVWTMVFTFVLREADKWKYVEAKKTLKRNQYNGGLLGF